MELHQQIRTPEQLLSIAEIETAGKKIIKIAQSRAFAEEINSLVSVNSNEIAKGKRNNKVYSLHPIIDEDQVLCIGGRFKNSSLSSSCTHSILLPMNGALTELLIRWCHEKTAHGGRDITLSEIRSSGYWIIDASSKRKNWQIGRVKNG